MGGVNGSGGVSSVEGASSNTSSSPSIERDAVGGEGDAEPSS